MSTASKFNYISVVDYLDGEARAKHKHEYCNGVIYAQAGASNVHNRIATNGLIELGSQLRGKPCQPFNSDTKIRIRQQSGTRFYYPDLSIVCLPNPPQDSYQDAPAVIIEVVSESTRRIDEGEKRDAYLTIQSLNTYLLLEQSSVAAIVYQRGERGFERRIYSGPETCVELPEIGCRLDLLDVYEGVEFVPEARPED